MASIREKTTEETLDELHDHAASHSRISMTLADWRKRMLDCLEKELPFCFITRYGIYRDAGIPASIYEDLDANVFHTALTRKIPKVDDARTD